MCMINDTEKSERVLSLQKELEEGKYYSYDCDVSNEGFVFWKKDGKVDYDVGDVDEYGDWDKDEMDKESVEFIEKNKIKWNWMDLFCLNKK